MTLSALEPKTELIYTPAHKVASERLTVEQANKQFRGMQTICPHCLNEFYLRAESEIITGKKLLYTKESLRKARVELLKAANVPETSQSLGWEKAEEEIESLMDAGITRIPQLKTKYVNPSLDGNGDIKVWMHWRHDAPKGSKLPCHKQKIYDPDNISHDFAVTCLLMRLQDDTKALSETEITREVQLPEGFGISRRPDLALLRKDRVDQVWEIQRSKISLEAFEKRTKELSCVCRDVRWVFFKSAYEQMPQHIRYLEDLGLTYYRLFRDGYKVFFDIPRKQEVVSRYGHKPNEKKHSSSQCGFREERMPETEIRQSSEVSMLPLSLASPVEFKKSSPSGWTCVINDRVEVIVAHQRAMVGKVISFSNWGPTIYLEQAYKGSNIFEPVHSSHIKVISRIEAQSSSSLPMVKQESLFDFMKEIE